MWNGIFEILFLVVAAVLVFGIAGLMVGALYAWEECVKFAAFRMYELFEQHWGGL